MGLFKGLLGHRRKDQPVLPPPVPVDANGNPIDPRLLEIIGQAPQEQREDRSLGAILQRAGPRLAVARAYADGDYRAAAALQESIAERQGRQALAEQQAAARYQQALKVAGLPGMNERELAAYMANPDQWGAQMAEAMSSHHAAVNLGQTETRVFGDPTQGGHTYQPTRLIENGVDQVRYDPQTGQSSIAVQGMTDGEQYARSLGLEPGTAEWASALRDAELKANGPSAYRQRTQLENQRQQGRMQVRQQPTYRDLNPPPARPRNPAARARQRVVNVSTPAEAAKLPPGTRYRGPDGVVRER